MTGFFLAIAILLLILITLCLYRVAVGPTVFDRIIAAGLVGTKGVILLLLIGYIYKRMDMFVDIAIIYAMFNFISVIMICKYFESGKSRKFLNSRKARN
ncbi:monovalent cation/H+ antiporter complex subunit F [Chloroflexota bacterium]